MAPLALLAPRTAPELSDERVAERVLAGEPELFELLMRRYNQRLFRVARSVVATDAEAEDVMQETYVRAFTHLGQFDGRAKLGTWLTRIALYEALARKRKGSRFVPLGPEPMGVEADREGNPEQQAARRQLGAVLETALGELPAAARLVFVLREVEGLTTAETAECLGVSEEAAKVRLHRAKARLRASVTRQLGAANRELFAFFAPRCDRLVAAVLSRLAHP